MAVVIVAQQYVTYVQGVQDMKGGFKCDTLDVLRTLIMLSLLTTNAKLTIICKQVLKTFLLIKKRVRIIAPLS